MIREDRDRAFWSDVFEHPEVKPRVSLGLDFDIAEIVGNPGVIPLRAEHGGFLFIRLDGLGRVYELHTLFKPEGWGREAARFAKAAFVEMFSRGAELIVTHEVASNWRSRPPKSFRFAPVGAFAPVQAESLRTWILTRDAWEVSPARQRM